MTTLASSHAAPRSDSWLSRSEAWLDDKGKGAWIAAMVLAFILFWPLGLALLAYMIWSKRMFSNSCRSRRQSHGHEAARMGRRHGFRSSGNTAFDGAAREIVHAAGPYPNPPKSILSGNGKVYMHWTFHRDNRACGTFGAQPFILDNAGEGDRPDPRREVRPGKGGGERLARRSPKGSGSGKPGSGSGSHAHRHPSPDVPAGPALPPGGCSAFT